ncbi:hypothetical protein QJS10_CPB19g01158 [Acorus calamus]|uniref:Uncharacterized protein n=1 Tax=Acorus calamus TaxID=4465 RepID=A0AAV9CIW7_ACOCL|nr:hypothetical protein QJS10_CPB19g01158 [Acorus calamus]
MAYPISLRNIFVLVTLFNLVVLFSSLAEARTIGDGAKFTEDHKLLLESLPRGSVPPSNESGCTNVPGRPSTGICPPPNANANMNFAERDRAPKPEFHGERYSN